MLMLVKHIEKRIYKVKFVPDLMKNTKTPLHFGVLGVAKLS